MIPPPQQEPAEHHAANKKHDDKNKEIDDRRTEIGGRYNNQAEQNRKKHDKLQNRQRCVKPSAVLQVDHLSGQNDDKRDLDDFSRLYATDYTETKPCLVAGIAGNTPNKQCGDKQILRINKSFDLSAMMSTSMAEKRT